MPLNCQHHPLSFSVQPWHQNMTACPTVNWPWCSQCSWTCWVWYPCCWGSSPHWRSKVETLGICWCTQGPCWCSFPWQAGSCGTAATLRVWPPERSWGAQLVELWTASHGPWAAGYGSPGLAAAQLRKRSPKIPTDWLTDCYKEGCPSPGSRPSCLRQRSATAVCGSLHKHASCDNKHLVHMTKKTNSYPLFLNGMYIVDFPAGCNIKDSSSLFILLISSEVVHSPWAHF